MAKKKAAKKPAAKKPAAAQKPAAAKAGSQVTHESLRTTLRAAAERFLAANRKALKDETPYAFLFEIGTQSVHAHGALATEEGLARSVAEEDDPKLAAKAFRWGSTEDGGWIQQPDSAFAEANAQLARARDAGLFQECDEDEAFEGLCLDVLRELAAADTFGTGAARKKIALGVCGIGGPEVPGDLLLSVKAVNPPEVWKRVKREADECEDAQGELD